MPEDAVFLRKSDLMTGDEIIKLAEIFVSKFGIKKIRFTGGEPLVRSDASKIIESIGRFPIEHAITTNGVLLDNFLALFRKIGLTSINVSLDSLIPERFEKIAKRPHFHLVKSNIDRAISEGFHIRINMVVMRNVNDDEILNFVEWTLRSPIHARFIEFMPFKGNYWQRNNVIPNKELMERIESVYPLEKLADVPNSTSKCFRVEGAPGTIAFINTVTEPFCQSCNRLRLTADGMLRNCLFARNEVDLLSALRTGADIENLIRTNISSKAAVQGGTSPFESITEKSMASIGG